jgi:hypothetical protein
LAPQGIPSPEVVGDKLHPSCAEHVELYQNFLIRHHDVKHRGNFTLLFTFKPSLQKKAENPVVQKISATRFAPTHSFSNYSSRASKHSVFRKIFEPKREEDGSWRKLHNELHDLYSSPNIVRVIKTRRMRWVGHVARMGEGRGAYRVLVGRPEGKRPLGRPRRRWEDNIKMDLREIGIDGANWIRLAQDRVQWRAFVNTVMNLRVP